MSNYCILNGIYSNELTGLLVSSLPPISKPLMRTQIETIDGRDGDIVTNLGYSAYDKQMEIGLYGDYDIDEIIAFFASEGTVTFSNEPDKYYHYTIVDQIDFERLVRYRKATVTFHCQPYKYDATETEIDFTNTITEDTEPYIFRANQHDANMMKLRGVVGGTIAWNQQLKNSNAVATYTKFGLTFTRLSNVFGFSVSGTFASAQDRNAYIYSPNPNIAIVSGHKYLVTNTSKYANVYMFGVTFTGNWIGKTPHGGSIVSATGSGSLNMSLNFGANITEGTEIDEDILVNLFDLTQMFGSTIADYIYSLEQAHAGDGVAWFKALFPKAYYPYNAGELLSVKTSARKTYNADNVEIGSYPLDDALTLRGIPKLDSNNELYYDGDTYASDGTVTRKYGIRAYTEGDATDGSTMITDGTNTVYKLITPTTESADAYTQSQRVGATEEFVDERSVPIPVGNNTLYYDGTPEIVVTNAGNAISKPILTIYGSGDITVSLNSNQIFSIALGDYEYITIDTNAMEAYMGGVLLNRLVTGDYADFALAVGDNTLSFTGDVSEVMIENYSRWI